ncbi:MAG: ATP-binding protein [Acidimicrobiia bacterium]
MFVNRQDELAQLERWWASGEPLGLVWGRRRVGKTMLLGRFAEGRPLAVVHTGGRRPPGLELQILSAEVARAGLAGTRDLVSRPYSNWDEAFEALTSAARVEPVLVVLDEFPELVATSPELEGVLRALCDALPRPSPLRVLLCGSAVRTMEALAEERRPLFGRFGLRMAVHPFRPHEAGLLLHDLDPSTRAVVWGLVGGTPLYLSWWDQAASVRANLAELVCSPAGRLLTEGQLILATEGDNSGLSGQVMAAIAAGRTKFGEIKDAVRTDPTRTLERLVELRLVERMVPVLEDPARTRRAVYRIADNFLAFWLGIVDRHRSEIDRGLGPSILSVVLGSLDDHLGPRFEEAFRQHLRREAAAGAFGDVVAIGPSWSGGADEIDAVALAGRERRAVLVGEAKWTRRVDARRVEAALHRKAASLPSVGDPLRLAVAAREEVTGAAPGTFVVTAADIFGGPGRSRRAPGRRRPRARA